MTIRNKKFTKEFKLEALRLASQPGTCIAQLARDLDIRRNMIYKWRKQLNLKQDKAFPRQARIKKNKRAATNNQTDHHKATHSELLKENKRLSKALKLAQMEAEILKKAQAYFEDQNS
ncbi:transposase [Candidatus Thioglobus sp.]|uniref:transposase n=1 Tax=Candidatus Thioglobus sp. TaxID=2026721 RepID=UPI003D123188